MSYRTKEVQRTIYDMRVSEFIYQVTVVLYGVLVDPNFLDGVKKVFISGEARDLVDPYLTFSFGGGKVNFTQQQDEFLQNNTIKKTRYQTPLIQF